MIGRLLKLSEQFKLVVKIFFGQMIENF